MNNKFLTAFFLTATTAILGFGAAFIYREQALLREVEVKYAGVKFTKMSFNNSVLKIFLRFINKSSIDVVVEQYFFKVFINKKQISEIVSPSPGYIAANAESQTELNVQFNPMQVLSNVFSKDVLSSVLTDYSKVNVTVSGTISIRHRGIKLANIPIEVNDTLANLMSSGT